MSAGILPKDSNFIAAIGGVSSLTDSASSIRAFQYDPTTRGMLVHIAGEVAPTTVSHAKTTVTTSGTRVQLASNACKSIVIKALSTNLGKIFVGSVTVSSANGFQLSAGDTVALDISNSNVIYIDAETNGEGISFLTIN